MSAEALPQGEPRHRLDEAVNRSVGELSAAIALHRDTLATVTVERTTLASQLAQAEGSLADAPMGSPHRRAVAGAVEQLRARLHAADSVSEVAARALKSCEIARDTLLAAAPDSATDGHGVSAGVGSRRIFQVVEDERMRIARDMHDGPAQLLANLVLKAEIVERFLEHDPKMVKDEMADFKKLVRVALDETRQLIFDLRPMTLDDLGLVPTLQRFANDYEDRWGVQCRVKLLGVERRIDRDHEAALFRIVQEAMHNARKHAMASAVEVTISLSPQRVTCTVSDDGRGFDVAAKERESTRSNHLGLTSMRERATLIGAVLDINSAPHRGTSVRVSLTT